MEQDVALIAGIGPGIGEGNAVQKLWKQSDVSRNVKVMLQSTMLLGCAIAETTGIYGFVTGLLLIFVAPGMFMNFLGNREIQIKRKEDKEAVQQEVTNMQVQELVGIVPWTFIAQICNLFIQVYLIKRFLVQAGQ